MNKLKLFAALFLVSLSAHAQVFTWETPVDPVPTDGYYKILLQPDVTSQLKTDFSDVRIYDKDSVETPYLIYKDEATQGVDRFVSYQITDKHYETGCCSHITVKNSLDNPIDHIVLEVNNADARREMTLTGSYDGENFFALRDEFTVESFNTFEKGARKTTSLIRFDFPLTDYKYYRFNFDDWRYWWWHDNNHPIFVVRAGYTEPTFIPEECLLLPVPAIAQSNDVKKKQSDIRISFPDSEYVDHLRFSIHTKKAGGDYYRAATLYQIVETKTKTGIKQEEQFVASTILSSVNANEINLGRMQFKNLVLRIDNEDNQPVIVDTVRAFQVKHYLVAQLEKNNHYVIRFGNDTIPGPVYDLKYFKEKIPLTLFVIKTGKRESIAVIHKQEAAKKLAAEKAEAHLGDGIFKDRRVIWAAIGIVILLLGFMTVRMLKEMKGRDSSAGPE